MSRLFVSYRRKSWAFTHRLAKELERRIKSDIFVDVDGVDQADFEKSILGHLRESDAVILVISETTFADRIHKDDDWVRREIRVALEENKPLILVCVEGLLPPPGLPEDIHNIARMQGINFYPEYFSAAVDRLAEFIIKLGVASPVLEPVKEVATPVKTDDPEPEDKEVKGRPTLDEALDLLEDGDYRKAIFLIEGLVEAGFESNYINLNHLLQQARDDEADAERVRQAKLDYEDIILLAKRTITEDHARKAFADWSVTYADLVDEIDINGYAQKFAHTNEPEPVQVASTPPQATEPVKQASPAEADTDPSIVKFADQLKALQHALETKQLDEADKISKKILRDSTGFNRFTKENPTSEIPKPLFCRMCKLWEDAGTPLNTRFWMKNYNGGITDYVALFSFKTYLSKYYEEVGC